MAIPWGAIIGLAGQIAGGVMSAKNNREQQEMADQNYQQQRAYLIAKENEDPLQRSENKAALNKFDRDSKAEVEKAQNVGTIMGATPEYSLAVGKGIADSRQDLMSNIVKGESARRDKFDERINTLDTNKAASDLETKAARQQTFANVMTNAASAAGSLIDGVAGLGEAKAPSSQESTTATSTAGGTNTTNSQKQATGTGVIQQPTSENGYSYVPKPDENKPPYQLW